MSKEYGFGSRLALPFTDAIVGVTAALKQEGFGILTEIDVKATLKAKIGVDYQPYVILGACNPNLAYRGLQAEPDLGLLLPCNVIIYPNVDGSSTVSIIDPLQMLGFVNNPALQPIAEEANSRLRRVIEALPDNLAL
ncbi:DUF302 domain-containing protein [soil metagenome]